MDTNKLSNNIKIRFDHRQARLVLRETYQAKMLFTHNGGMWCAGPDLIMLCKACEGTVVLEDYYQTPISVDSDELLEISMQRWQEQMNAWQNEYNKMSKIR